MNKIIILSFNAIIFFLISLPSFASMILGRYPAGSITTGYYEGIITTVDYGVNFDMTNRSSVVYIQTKELGETKIIFDDVDLQFGHSAVAAIGKRIEFHVKKVGNDYHVDSLAITQTNK